MSDNGALWERHRREPTAETRRLLVECYGGLAKYVVDRLNIKTTAAIAYDDLLGEAIVGLMDAIDRFDPTRGVKFETYAYTRIRGAVVDMLREMDWAPRSLRSKEAELRDAYSHLEAELGRPATDAEVADAMGIGLHELNDLAHEVGRWAVISLEESLASDENGQPLPVGDTIPDDDAVSPEEHVEEESRRACLAEAIDGLPDQERTVISLYYHDSLTLKEIGQVLGVTESRVCQVHSKAVTRLRAKFARQSATPVA
jgi:RNA polymerase sigma factor for flagellar operon FliA